MGILNVCFVGLGNFGGQVANEAVAHDIESLAVNASEKDLALLNPDVIPFLVGDGKGTGKNRDAAKEFLLDHISLVKDDTFTKFMNSHDVVFVCGSAGGGFGSGATPQFVNVMKQIYPDKCFIIITTFPSDSETYTAQNHTEEFMREMLELGVPYIVYDNDMFKNMEASDMNKAIVSNAISDMKVLRGDYVLDTSTGGIDERDLLTVISTPGRIMISTLLNLDESKVETSIVNTLKTALTKTGNALMVNDKIISASATMYNFSNDLKKYAPAIIHDIQDVFGDHVADYRNEVMDDKSSEPFIVCILSGLTAPTTRMDKVIARRQQIEDVITTRQSASTKLNSVDHGSLKLNVKSFGAKNQKTNIDDILKNIKINN